MSICKPRLTSFRFDCYDVAELALCGEACVRNFEPLATSSEPYWRTSTSWTEEVLRWFTEVQPVGVIVDTSASSAKLERQRCGASRSRTRAVEGEFLKLDLVASRGPRYRRHNGRSTYWTESYWQQLLDTPNAEPLLALESEWKGQSSESRYANVMHSAAKLAWVRTHVKVLVFASRRRGIAVRDRLGQDIERLRLSTADKSPWLLVDLPEFGKPAYAVVGDTRANAARMTPAARWKS